MAGGENHPPTSLLALFRDVIFMQTHLHVLGVKSENAKHQQKTRKKRDLKVLGFNCHLSCHHTSFLLSHSYSG